MRTVKSYPEAWPLHSPFVISRGSRTEAHVVVVEIEQDGLKGIGEATPYARYGESEASVLQQIASQLGALQNGMTRAARCNRRCRPVPRATRLIARCGIWSASSSAPAWRRCVRRCRHRRSSRRIPSASIRQKRWPAARWRCGSTRAPAEN